MADGFSTLNDEQKQLIEQHLNLVIEKNKVVNLTRIDTVESGMLLHVEDSLSALEEFNDAIAGNYIDLGSGGGYPGLPLAIASQRKTVLLDARQKKVEVLNEIIAQLGLSHYVRAEHSRIEDYSRTHKGNYAVVTARALAQLSVLFELASPLLCRGGSLICYKAQLDESEIKHAKKIGKQTGMQITSKRDFVLSDGVTKRCIVVAKKMNNSSITLPRKDGFAQKKPL